jgi:prepilin-type N-terminal cleavage/methylation domain-containing protein
MQLKFRNNRGVTLLELMIVIIVLGLISAQSLKLIGMGYSTLGSELKLKSQRDTVGMIVKNISADLLNANKYEVQTIGSSNILIITTRSGDTTTYKFTDHGFLSSIDKSGIETQISAGYCFDTTKPMVQAANGFVTINYYLSDVSTLLDYAIKPRFGVPS